MTFPEALSFREGAFKGGLSMGKSHSPRRKRRGEWTGEPSIWLRQTAVGFFPGISPGRIGGTSSRNKIEELSL